MNTLYQNILSFCVYGTATASIMGGFSIYKKWNRGEEIKPLIFTWLYGILLSNVLFWAVDRFFIQGQNNSKNIVGLSEELADQVYLCTLILGIIIAILACISIYNKYVNGEDVTKLLFSWVGSLIFLFAFGKIISAML
jgi:formate/nitrite transporter FocA (FNT family)